jgi:hypothetical protein
VQERWKVCKEKVEFTTLSYWSDSVLFKCIMCTKLTLGVETFRAKRGGRGRKEGRRRRKRRREWGRSPKIREGSGILLVGYRED